jgi:hypothetical protein
MQIEIMKIVIEEERMKQIWFVSIVKCWGKNKKGIFKYCKKKKKQKKRKLII